MPYATVLKVQPAPGKGPEVAQKGEEMVRQVQASGVRAAFSSTLFGDDPAFYLTAVFDSLAALEPLLQDLQARRAELRPLLSSVGIPSLNEVIAEPPAGGQPPAFQTLFTLSPQGGKQQEFMALLMQRMQVEQGSGTRAVVSIPVSGNIGTVGVLVLFGSLAELEKDRALRATDAAWLSFTTQMAGLSAAPPYAEVRRVIVPLPPQ